MTSFRQIPLALLLLLPIGGRGEGQDESENKSVTLSPAKLYRSKDESILPGKLEVPPDGGSTLPLLSRVMPVVEGSVGSGVSERFLLDTACSATVLSPSQVARWELPIRVLPDKAFLGFFGSITVNRCARLDRLALGNALARDVDAVLCELSHLHFFSGIAGVSILSQCPLLLDGGQGEARFLPVESLAEILATLYPEAHWSKLSLYWDGGCPSVKLDAGDLFSGDRILRMIVDTGASSSGLQPATVRELGLQALRKEAVLYADVFGTHQHELDVFRLERMRLGNWICDLETSRSHSPSLATEHMDGVLGFDLLGQVPCVFDAPGGMLWVLDPPAGAQAVLRSSGDSAGIAWFQDPLPDVRKWAAESVARIGRRRHLPHVAALLKDEDPEVQEAAAAALSTFAQETWPQASRLQDARAWWEKHKGDPEFQPQAKNH